ncbi:fungal-specific transcription factor domain-containing protein [Mucidula mucida]|nr:fungal-specific transcription factor domain-containing protein [Mucidula mucida]
MRKSYDDSEGSSKKRRLPRACDNCKRKKIRCDSDEMPGKRCSNCISFNVQCTHVEALNSMGSAKGYVQRLEQRLEKMEEVFKRRLPDIDLTQELLDEPAKDNPSMGKVPTRSHFDEAVALLSHDVNKLLLIPPEKRFFGKSCGLHLIPSVLQQKNQYLGKEGSNPLLQAMSINKRDEFWDLNPWYSFKVEDIIPEYSYPDDDLMTALVELYFQFQNCYLPLLHRPTFEKAIRDRLYWTDHRFGATVLLVCALGARNSEDPRVFVDGRGEAGWKWFDQVSIYRTALQSRELTTLYEFQMHSLSALYLEQVGMWESVWTQVGIALRVGQDVGAHMHRANPPNARDEHWKRAFWVLFFIDVSLAALYGRPMSLNYEDFDVDFPIECDDVYWDHPDPAQNFTQPPGQPSVISYFSRKPLILLGGYRRPSEPEILASFDSILDQWAQAVPSHLVWDPTNLANDLFFSQAAFLHVTYQYARILLHRPYILGLFDTVQLSESPSVKVCLRSSHSCLDTIAEMGRRGQYIESLHIISCVNSSTLTLLFIMYGTAELKHPDLQRVHAALDMMKSVETRLPSAGAFWDVISELVSRDDDSGPPSAVGAETTLPVPESPPRRKRQREVSSPPKSSSTISRTSSRQSLRRNTDRRRSSDAARFSHSHSTTPPIAQGFYQPPGSGQDAYTQGFNFATPPPLPYDSAQWRQHTAQRRMSEPFFTDMDAFGGHLAGNLSGPPPPPPSNLFNSGIPDSDFGMPHITAPQADSWRYAGGIGYDSDPERHLGNAHDADQEYRQHAHTPQDPSYFYHPDRGPMHE